jgi:RNA polymerase sigma-70 factor (ECF subfamily)
MTGDGGLSEDLAQEVFFRVLKYKDTYHPDRPFLAWMYQIARNLMTDTARKRKFEVLPGDFEVVSGDDGQDEEMARSQEISLLRRALAKLPIEKREVLVLSRFQNLKYEEIAAMLGCEVNTVKVRVYRAVRALGENYRQLAGERAV